MCLDFKSGRELLGISKSVCRDIRKGFLELRELHGADAAYEVEFGKRRLEVDFYGIEGISQP